MESLLGSTVIVDNYDNAVRISRKYRYAHRMVTLTGERINNDGSLEGGSAKSQKNVSNLLSYETQIAERVQKAKRGDIILCHNNSDHIVEALPLILEAMKLKGLTVVPVGELVYHSNYYIDATGKQNRQAHGGVAATSNRTQ